MDNKSNVLKTRLKQDVVSCSLTKNDLHKLCLILQERANTALEYEYLHFHQNDQTDEDYQKNKQTLKDGYQVRLTIEGDSGQELFGTIADVFESPNFPENVTTLYINTSHFLKTIHNYQPRNSFTVLLDFKKPKVLDFSLLPSLPTPNGSHFEVYGEDNAWANGVFAEISNFIKLRNQMLSILHKHSIYDVLIWVLGYPFSFYICYKSSRFIELTFSSFSTFLKSGFYLYIGLFTLVFIRFLYHYARWVYPILEYKSELNKSLKHKVVIVSLFLGSISKMFTDLMTYIFK